MEMNKDMQNKDMKRTAVYLARNILMDDINAGNKEILEKAFSCLGLHGNQRILEKEKNCIKLAENISDHIYEDILEIVLEEIFEKNNQKALDLLTCHYSRRFPGMADLTNYDNDPESLMERINTSLKKSGSTRTTCMILYYLLYGKNMTAKNTILCEFKDAPAFSEFIEANRNSRDHLEVYMKIKDLKSMRSYQDFLSRQRKCLTNYLGIKYGQLEKYIFENADSCADPSCIIPETYAVKNLQDILMQHGISITGALNHDAKKCLDMIRRNFENLCCSRLLLNYFYLIGENPETTLNETICEADIEAPASFLISLSASFYYELLVVKLKEFMEDSCRNFSTSRPAEPSHEQELASENQRLKAEIEKLKEKLKQQEAASQEIRRKHAKEAKNAVHEHELQIRMLNRQLEKQKEINSSLQQDVSKSAPPACGLKDEDNPAEDRQKMDMSRLAGKKILFLGGSPGIVKKLKNVFRNAYFIENNTAPFPDKIDMTVILAKFVGHSLVRKHQSSGSGTEVTSFQC